MNEAAGKTRSLLCNPPGGFAPLAPPRGRDAIALTKGVHLRRRWLGSRQPGRGAASPGKAPGLICCLLLLFALASQAFAVEPSERLADPALEARARALSATLRCLVCQNESIDDSAAGLAHDIRVLLRQRLLAGDTDVQARQAIVDRYGEFVLLKPPVQPATYALWFGPGVLLLAGLAGSVFWLRRRPAATVAPLTREEQIRLDSLLREADR